MKIFILIFFLIWVFAFVACSMGFADNNIPPTVIPIICVLLPIVNFCLAIYLWHKIIKRNHYKFGDSIRSFINKLKEL